MRRLDHKGRAAAGYACTFGLMAALVAGCGNLGNNGPHTGAGSGGAGGHGSASDGAGGDLFPSGANGSSTSGSGVVVPMNFVNADVGAYALGAPITGDGVTNTGVDNSDGCKTLVGVVRDFKGLTEPGGDPDFEDYSGAAQTTGLVGSTLGNDSKPVYGGQCDTPGASAACPYGQQMTSKADFDEWYRYTSGVNKPYILYLKFAEDMATKVSTFKSTAFFPLDNAGWGNSAMGGDNKEHNYGFTTEIHTQFKYAGGEVFTFTGDDDLWVFINKKLAIDLGGLHAPATSTINLDQVAGMLGITKGGIYPLELFNAERHSTGSNFRVDTNLGFVDCGSIPPEPK